MKRHVAVLVVALFVAASGIHARIFNGSSDNSAEVVRVAGQCSGVFVSAKMILTAKHCFTSEKSDTLVASPEMGNQKGFVPEGGFFEHDDLAIVCAENPTGNTASIASTAVQKGDPIVVKGYGWKDDNTRDAVRRRGTTSVAHLIPGADPKADRFRIEAGNGGPCPGDSGGPVYNKGGDLVGISEQFNSQSKKCGGDTLATVTVPSSVRAVMKRVTGACDKF